MKVFLTRLRHSQLLANRIGPNISPIFINLDKEFLQEYLIDLDPRESFVENGPQTFKNCKNYKEE